MSTTATATATRGGISSTSSFEYPYSLELLSYLRSVPKTPFEIFDEIVIPDIIQHLSKGRELLPIQSNHNDSNEIIEGDKDNESHSSTNDPDDERLLNLSEEIYDNLIYIKKACGKIKRWEANINMSVRDLVLRSLDDAFKERNHVVEYSVRARTKFLEDKLGTTCEIVSKLKESICQPLELSSVKLDSDSFKNSNFSMKHKEASLRNGDVHWPIQLPDVNIDREVAEITTFERIQDVYNDLDLPSKLCFLCFSVFPENAIIKKKVLFHWWIGEGFLEYPFSSNNCEDNKTVEERAKGFFKQFIAKGVVEPVYKKRRPGPDSCKMHPFVRYAVIMLAEKAGFMNFDVDRNPKSDFSGTQRSCLVRSHEEQASSARELTYCYSLKQENLQTLFNISEPDLDFRLDWFSKMKYVKVLQLGRWQSSSKHLIEIEDAKLLKGLKEMKHLRYLSLRGVSRITELPGEICKLTNLRILNLNGCHDLEKLPDGIGSLKKLTHLDMYECYLISHMPKGLGLLTELQVLKGFVIGKPRSGGEYCNLDDLVALKNLKKLSIHIDRNHSSSEAEKELNCLAKFEKLSSLTISWSRIYDSYGPQKRIHQRLTSKLKSMRERDPPLVPSPKSPSLPAQLEKLDLHYFPRSKMPTWAMPQKLENLKKLYIRGGKLGDLGQEQGCRWTVKVLRLKFLDQLQMDWAELQVLFPKLIYMENFKCSKLSFVPCDEDGVWKNEAEN